MKNLPGCTGLDQWRLYVIIKVVKPDAHGQQLNVPGTSLLLPMNVSMVPPLVFHKQRNSPYLLLTTLAYNPVCSER